MNDEPVAEGAGPGFPPNESCPDTRVRKLTEKGQEEKLRRLKNDQTAKTTAVTKQRNALTNLMEDENNLHLVKSEVIVLNTLFKEYQEARDLYYCQLTSEQDQDRELDRYESKEKSFLEFRKQVMEWMNVAERRLTEELDLLSEVKSASSKSSRVSTRSKKSSASSTPSARAKEKLKLAELQAEKQMLERKQALRAADEALKLETEIAKAQARERVYADLENDGNLENKDGIVPCLQQSEPKFMASTPAAHLNPAAPEFHSNSLAGEISPPANNGTTDVPQGIIAAADDPYRLEPHERSFKEVMAMQRQQNEQMIATHRQLAAAMTLPQPEVHKFKGDPIEYGTFIMAFKARIESRTFRAADCLYYLEQHLEREPRELIGGCLHMDPSEGYKEARRLLEKEYGDPFKVSMAYVNKALGWSPVRPDDASGLKRLSLFLIKCKNAMMSVSHMNELNHPTNLQNIAKKLPSHLQSRWRDRAAKLKENGRIASFKDLADFVVSAAESANDPVFGVQALSSTQERRRDNSGRDGKKKPSSATKTSNSFATGITIPGIEAVNHANRNNAGGKEKLCPFCSKNHDLDDCAEFLKRTMDERKTFLYERKLCFACYESDHVSKGCVKRRTCKKCKKRHPTALHIDGFTMNRESVSNKPQATEVQSIAVSNRRIDVSKPVQDAPSCKESVVLHAILPVKVKQKGCNNSVVTYAFYDNGSGGCFATENIRRQLGIDGVKVMLQLTTMHGQSQVESIILDDLIVTSLDDENPIELPRSYTRDEIPAEHHQIPTPSLINQWSHLSEVAKKIPELEPRLEIGLLIGSNCPPALEPLEVVPCRSDGPFALRLRHGWTVCGPLHIRTDHDKDKIIANRITVREVETPKEIIAPTSLLRMLQMDFNDHTVSRAPDERGPSQEDRKFLTMVERETKVVDGHYQVPLPLRHSDIIMPNNKEQAIKRANWQKKKMLRDSKYRSDYVSFVNDVIAKGYAQRVPNELLIPNPGKVWYLPHHGVYHPKKPEKIRVVFDCSSKFQGVSLNDCLMQGPDMTNSLVGVLTRFREDPVAFMGDVESMFHQVTVPPEQYDYLRFLWWPDGNLEAELQEYRMVVHLFGAASSPSVANFALKRTARDNEDKYGTLVADTLRNNFYVDDCLRSVSSEGKAVELIEGLRQSCKKGGFRLTKFTSNSRAVLESIPEDERSKEVRSITLDCDNLPIERALGIQWCVQSDCFGFRIVINSKPFTRRGVMSTISSIFDPLGFIAPFTLLAKKLLQDLCRNEDLDWDDDIPEDCRSKWLRWCGELPLLEQFHIDRCHKPPGFGPVVSRQLHLFSDASQVGYGCVAYLRLMDNMGRIHCSFLMGKARLAPIKAVTVPRLELTAATVSVRVGQMLYEELEVKPESIIYHTDSTTVLRYIRNERRRFQIFVANRVQLIRDFTSPMQWKYVDTSSNPADDASRGLSAAGLLQQQRWSNGPHFLGKSEKDWPQQPFPVGEVPDDDPEVRKVASAGTMVMEATATSVNKLIEYHSSWYRLRLSVAAFLRIKAVLRKRKEIRGQGSLEIDSDHGQARSGVKSLQAETKVVGDCCAPLSVQEFEEAEMAILRFVQLQSFSREFDALRQVSDKGGGDERGRAKQKKMVLKKASSLTRLDPYIHEGLLRVGGRLSRADDLPEETKHPIILPRKSHVTNLIIKRLHERLAHAGRGHTLAKLREKYWVTGANAAVRHLIANCVTCRRNRAPVAEQKMADLPKDRVTPAPPFTYTGVDYFGPYMIKEGRKGLKRYGCLFTCLASRAVHIETANSLETDSFIQALRRFIARRGPIREIRSDNGTNFVGAKTELQQAVYEMNNEQIRSRLHLEGTDWIFNPPSASHMGGIWERQIRTTRKILTVLLHEHGSRLDDESFRTLLCEVEAIINSRPLTFASSDPDDLNPLSPSNLLTMKTSVVLPPAGVFQRADVYMRRRWRRVQYLANLFWTRWKREYLPTLQPRSKWNSPKRNLAVGDVVLLKDDNCPRSVWPMGRVISAESDKKGLVRTVHLKTQTSQLRRPVDKVVLLLAKEEQSCLDNEQ